jgi:raffinose/stachyose/melibiose transport system substrate-binding protein
MKRKVLGTILCVVMVSSLFMGCGNSKKASESDSSGPTKAADAAADSTGSEISGDIEIFTRWADGDSSAYIQEVADDYMAENPKVKITVSAANNADYKQQINVRLASSAAPDIYFAWSGVYAENFAEGGRALDLTDYVKADSEWFNTIIGNQWGPFTFDDKIYGVPIIMDGKTFYYNQDIFNELGLQVPETWDEFMTVLDALGKTDYIPISLGNSEDWATGHYMTTLNQRMVNPDTLAADYALEGDFSSPQYIAALEKLRELIPYFTPDFNATSYDTGISDFINGKAAIYYEQFNQVQYIEPAAFNWSWFDFPDISEGEGDQNALTGAPQGLMVSSDTEYADACIDFIKFMTSADEAAKMVKNCSMISCVDGAINSDTANDKLIQIAETIKGASSITLWLDNAMDSEVVSVYLAGIQSMVGGNMTPEEVMAAAQKAAKALADE